MYGRTHTEEGRAKISEANTGKTNSEETLPPCWPVGRPIGLPNEVGLLRSGGRGPHPLRGTLPLPPGIMPSNQKINQIKYSQ